ncbi:MAG: VCBS repeat-containing protein [Deltaproteobacteria bacterium]|nr:VCBS repeat-containing protein [Deltaproteobacteria bacterium]
MNMTIRPAAGGYLALAPLLAWACGTTGDRDDAVISETSAPGSDGGTSTTAATSVSGQTTSATGPADSSGSGSGQGPIFDVGVGDESGTTGAPIDICKVSDEGDAMGPCEMKAPADSFAPMLQWSWAGQGSFNDSIVTPLVGNLTDDNSDGEIDLCDTPDIVVTVNTGTCADAHLFVLDGATGSLHFEIVAAVARASTPAIGDIDGDGLMEIVAQTGSNGSCGGSGVSAWEHDGTPKWQNDGMGLSGEHAIALADLDNDGSTEIIIANRVLDGDGNQLFAAGDTDFSSLYWTSSAAADLDDDGDLELVLGRSAWHHDGSQLFSTSIEGGHPTIGDIDDDGAPEIIVIQSSGFTILEHDGTVKLGPMNPTGDGDWRRPATIHDLDGDDHAEFAVSSSNHYTSFEGDASTNWSAPVADLSGLASGTAFDFLGDGIAEAIYGDESQLWVFDGLSGDVQLMAPRGSITIIEYPVVADVDNDGSAEIVVVTNHNDAHPTVQVYRDAQDRWIQARRIWNQHTYHVTNVREDGTIPQHEPPHWQYLNTFRTNAQIEGGSVCEPEG